MGPRFKWQQGGAQPARGGRACNRRPSPLAWSASPSLGSVSSPPVTAGRMAGSDVSSDAWQVPGTHSRWPTLEARRRRKNVAGGSEGGPT
eukprot:1631606-Prymnesium_polylepis.1